MVNHVLTPARSLAAYVGAFLMTYIESSAFEKVKIKKCEFKFIGLKRAKLYKFSIVFSPNQV